MKKISSTLIVCLLLLATITSKSQTKSLDIGLRFQKTQDLYYENGITAQYQLSKRWAIGGSYYTSRLGSALSSNAIKQDNFIVSAAYLFRPERKLRPFVRANVGYFIADYESELFDNLSNTSAIASADAGLAYEFNCPLKVSLSLGYNGITGSGDEGAGTLYPVFYQASVTWNIFKTHSR
ncbi:outer membrane beta-barrel protein [Pedobacter psychroterrae]|uniref:Uncharacterized protein n=1 Tax=Pedobacter psychroterrae TaxID=2530453 RepID=A0A4R0NHX2_9SPHI|nr:outer membrane beta-barrel protein [Pedobacter psychroterrae]TCD00192.1 hypothetical protein EZ437_15880 [Pedobacter psychroterrae]